RPDIAGIPSLPFENVPPPHFGAPEEWFNKVDFSTPMAVNGGRTQFHPGKSTKNVISPTSSVWTISGNDIPRRESNSIMSYLGAEKFYEDSNNEAVALGHFEKNRWTKKGATYPFVSFPNSRFKRNLDGYPDIWTNQGFGNSIYDQYDFPGSNGIAPDWGLQVLPSREQYVQPLGSISLKLFIVVDHLIFRYHNYNIKETVKYVATFWQKVDQMYAKFDSPKVNIIITGIAIAKDRIAANVMFGSWTNTNKLEVVGATQKVKDHPYLNTFKDQDPRKFDAIVVMTDSELTQWHEEHNMYSPVMGLTLVDEVCETIDSVVIPDNGHFHGVDSGVHELGHILGMQHDMNNGCGREEQIGKLNGKPLVMGVHARGEKVWSECSKRELREFVA
ncbi:hypothetical protein QAD02_000594, partial [Eretmocerus hayati]